MGDDSSVGLLRELVASSFEESNDYGTFCFFCGVEAEDSPEWAAVKAHNNALLGKAGLSDVLGRLEFSMRPEAFDISAEWQLPPSVLEVFSHEDGCLWARSARFLKVIDG